MDVYFFYHTFLFKQQEQTKFSHHDIIRCKCINLSAFWKGCPSLLLHSLHQSLSVCPLSFVLFAILI